MAVDLLELSVTETVELLTQAGEVILRVLLYPPDRAAEALVQLRSDARRRAMEPGIEPAGTR